MLGRMPRRMRTSDRELISDCIRVITRLIVLLFAMASVRHPGTAVGLLTPEKMEDEFAQIFAVLERIRTRVRAEYPQPRGRKPIHEKWRAQFPRWSEQIKTGRKKLVDLLKEVPEKGRKSVETLYHLSQRREKTKK